MRMIKCLGKKIQFSLIACRYLMITGADICLCFIENW